MNRLLFIFALFLLKRSSVKSDKFEEQKIDTKRRGDIDCRNIMEHFPVTVQAAFRAPKGVIYVWLKTEKGIYLSKIQDLKEGKWFRVFDAYPKSYKKWKEDFSNFPNIKIPLATVYTGTNVYIFLDNTRYITYSYNPVKFKDPSSERSLLTHSNNKNITSQANSFYILKNKVLRFMYTSTRLDTEEKKFYFSDYYPPESFPFSINFKTDWTQFDENVHGGFMYLELEKATIGYSFQGNFSVPLAAVVYDQEITFSTILKTMHSKTVEFGDEMEDIFEGISQPNKLIIPNELWLGCPTTDTCIRFLIDDAVKIDPKHLLLFSGRMVFEISSLKTKLSLSNASYINGFFRMDTIPTYIDAAFTNLNRSLFLVKDKDFYELQYIKRMNSWRLIQKRDSFLKDSDTAEAIVRKQSSHIIYVFHGIIETGTLKTSIVSEYNIKDYEIISRKSQGNELHFHKFIATSSKYIEDVNENLAGVIDAAFIDPESTDLILAKNNFFMKINSSTFYKKRDETDWVPRMFFDCNTQKLNELLNETALSDYYMITKPISFKKANDFPKEQVTNKSLKTFVTTLLVIALVIAVLIVLTNYIYCKGGDCDRLRVGMFDIQQRMKSKSVSSKSSTQGKSEKSLSYKEKSKSSGREKNEKSISLRSKSRSVSSKSPADEKSIQLKAESSQVSERNNKQGLRNPSIRQPSATIK